MEREEQVRIALSLGEISGSFCLARSAVLGWDRDTDAPSTVLGLSTQCVVARPTSAFQNHRE